MLYVKLPMKDTGDYTLLIGASVSSDIWVPVKRRLHGLMCWSSSVRVCAVGCRWPCRWTSWAEGCSQSATWYPCHLVWLHFVQSMKEIWHRTGELKDYYTRHVFGIVQLSAFW